LLKENPMGYISNLVFGMLGNIMVIFVKMTVWNRYSKQPWLLISNIKKIKKKCIVTTKNKKYI